MSFFSWSLCVAVCVRVCLCLCVIEISKRKEKLHQEHKLLKQLQRYT